MSREVIFTLLALFPRMDLQNFTLTKNSVLMRTKKRQIYHTEKYSWSLHKVLSRRDLKKTFPTNPKINGRNKNVIRYLSRSLVG